MAPPTDEGSRQDLPSGPPYTIFSKRQKQLYALILGYLTLASPLTATVFLPLLPLLQERFETSAQAINVTLTVYLVFQGLSPVVFAPPSDVVGRRPIFLATFTLYTVSSLGLALNISSYALLLVLRALQSVGASAVLAVAYGVVADVSVPAERGRMLGAVMTASNLGPCFGPLAGGIIAWRSGSFPWAFWVLLVFGSIAFCLMGFGLPETARSVVGNGEHIKEKWSTQTWWSLLVEIRRSKTDETPQNKENSNVPREEGIGKGMQATPENSKEGRQDRFSSWRSAFRRSNPLSCLQIICHRDTSLVVWMSVSFYTVWYTILASIPPIFKSYGFSELLIGVSFLPGGFGVIVSGLVTGRIMDLNYKRTANEAGLPIDRHVGDNLENFPIEKARARGSAWLVVLFAITLLGFGWSVDRGTHPAVPLVLLFVMAFICTYFFQTFNSLLVDILPENPSTAAAAGTLSRCALSGTVVALLQPMVDAVGRGWFYTILCAFVTMGNVIALPLILTNGREWRSMRILKEGEDSRENDNEDDTRQR